MADFLLKLLIALVLASAAGCGSAQQEEQNQIEEEVMVNPIEVKPITVKPLDSSEILWETVTTQTWD